MILLMVGSAGSVAVPDAGREPITDVLSPESDVPEHAVAEFAQFLPRTGALAPQPDGSQQRPPGVDEDGDGGGPNRSAKWVPMSVERGQAVLAVQTFIYHRNISLMLSSPLNAEQPAMTVPPCSRQLIWQINARSPAQNLLSFCSLLALKQAGKDRAEPDRPNPLHS